MTSRWMAAAAADLPNGYLETAMPCCAFPMYPIHRGFLKLSWTCSVLLGTYYLVHFVHGTRPSLLCHAAIGPQCSDSQGMTNSDAPLIYQ
jgi:hypothetical protein